MRRSSIILLIVCGVILTYLIAVFVSIHSTSQPDFSQDDASEMLNRLGRAYEASDTEAVLSFAAPNATVAGRQLDEIRQLLHQAFGSLKEQHVKFSDITYSRDADDQVTLHFKAAASGGGGGNVYEDNVTFTVRRILMPRLGGLMHVYEWKVTNVQAPHLPDTATM